MTRTASIRTAKRRRIFLETLADTAMIAAACRAAGLSRGAVYGWREAEPEFAAEWDRALEMAVSALEDEAILRARDGIEVPVIRRGKVVGTRRRRSDQLLMFLLKARWPDRYGDGSGDSPEPQPRTS